jgi:hypothetical protein
MFLGLNACSQGGSTVVLKDWYSRLGNHRSGIYISLNQMGSATTDPHRRLQSLPNSIETLKAGQKGRVDIQQSVWEGFNQDWSDNPHPSSHHD